MKLSPVLAAFLALGVSAISPAAQASRLSVSASKCGAVRIPSGGPESHPISVDVHRVRHGNPEDQLTCAQARGVIRRFVAGRQMAPQYLCSASAARLTCSAGNRVGWVIWTINPN